MSLYPTKTRLALLRAVAAGAVIEGLTEETEGRTVDTSGAEWGEQYRVVTARVEELKRAGWVELGLDLCTWEITDAGRKVLEPDEPTPGRVADEDRAAELAEDARRDECAERTAE